MGSQRRQTRGDIRPLTAAIGAARGSQATRGVGAADASARLKAGAVAVGVGGSLTSDNPMQASERAAVLLAAIGRPGTTPPRPGRQPHTRPTRRRTVPQRP
jgi:hypothetical protein